MSADFDPDPVSGSILETLVTADTRDWVILSDIQDHFAAQGVRVSDVVLHERVDLLQSQGFVEKSVEEQSPVQVTTSVRLTAGGAKVAGTMYGSGEGD